MIEEEWLTGVKREGRRREGTIKAVTRDSVRGRS